MRADFNATCYGDTVVESFAPWFRVQFDDGDSAEYAGNELAPLVDLSDSGFYDPRLWFYGPSVIHLLDIPAFRRALIGYAGSTGFDLPPIWCAAGGGKASPDEYPYEYQNSFDEVMAFIADEAWHLAELNREFRSGSRAQRTSTNLRNPGPKLIWSRPRAVGHCRSQAAKRSPTSQRWQPSLS